MALVANELLAFIQHAIDTVDEVNIKQICKSSFTSEDISTDKLLLYEMLGQSANMPSRGRYGGERSVQDIISLLKQTDPNDVPVFVAKDLHKTESTTSNADEMLKNSTFKMTLTLYTFELSPCARAVHMVIHKLGLTVQYVEVNVLKKEQFDENYLKINPQHTIPTLVDDELVIIDSHAIVTYLMNKYSPDDELYPTEPQLRAMVDQRLHFDSGSLFTALRMAVGDLLSGNKCIRAEIIERITSGYEFIEMFLTSDWIAGDHLTLADICCVATVTSLNAIFPIDSELYPNLKAWLLKCSELDFYKVCNEPGLALFKEAMFA